MTQFRLSLFVLFVKSDANLRDRGFDFAFASLIFEGRTVEVEDQRADYGERRMVAIRSGPLTAVAMAFNVLGLIYVTLPIRLAIAGFLAYRRRWWHFGAFVSAVVLSEILIGTTKSLYHRTRPAGSLVHTSGGSFPSGHAVAISVTVLPGDRISKTTVSGT